MLKKKRKPLSRTERRFVNHTAEPALKVEYRDCDGVSTPTIMGTAIVFNSESRDLGGFQEKINPNALDAFFERKGDEVDVAALWSHDTSQVLGRTPNTLKLKRDDDGLHFELTPPNSRQDIVELVERSDVRGASFAFTVAKGGEQWDESRDGVTIREINEIDELFEISLVLTPAYEATQVGLAKRSLAGWRRRQKNISAKQAKKNAEVRSVVGSLKDYLNQRGS
jgi:HK97 family phage prohead protease